ncbi:hypothetical protein ES705_47052 [subsurface metagenome]
MVSPSDWIFVFLAIIALFGPYIYELWRRNSLAPKLKIGFYKESSHIILALQKDSFSIFFEVNNSGNSEAKNCIVIIEELCYKNEGGNFIKMNTFPAKLLAPGSPINILPKASNFFELLYIFKNGPDKINSRIHIEPLVNYNQRKLNLKIPSICLKIKIVIYSENAKKCVQQIEVNSPGIWREDIKQILQEIQITLS